MVLTSNFYCFIPKCFLFEKHFSFLSVLPWVPLNPVQDGCQKEGPTSSSAVTSVNPYKIEVMRTSLIKMLELPKFGHMTTSII